MANEKMENGGFDFSSILDAVESSEQFKKADISKVSRFDGDITKTITGVSCKHTLKFLAPKEWNERDVEQLITFFNLARENMKQFKNVSVSPVYKRKDGCVAVDFETPNNKEMYGDGAKKPPLKELIKACAVRKDPELENEVKDKRGKMVSAINKCFRESRVADIKFSFTDIDDNDKPLNLGEKGFFGFFIINDLLPPVTVLKSGKRIANNISASFLINPTFLPKNVQLNCIFPQPEGKSFISVRGFKSDDSVAIKRMFNRELIVLALDVIDSETKEVETKNKKGKVTTEIQTLYTLGFHACVINHDKNGFTISNFGPDNDGSSIPNPLEFQIADILNFKMNNRSYRDENGAKVLLGDRLLNETNLENICIAIEDAIKNGSVASVDYDNNNCPYETAKKFNSSKGFTIGDAVEAQEKSEDEEVEEGTVEVKATDEDVDVEEDSTADEPVKTEESPQEESEADDAAETTVEE